MINFQLSGIGLVISMTEEENKKEVNILIPNSKNLNITIINSYTLEIEKD